MRKIRDVLRLKFEAGLSERAVGDAQAAHDRVERVLTMAWNDRS